MGLNIEAAKNYAGSVVGRTVGINAYKRWQRYAQRAFTPTDEEYKSRKSTGIFTGLMQIAMPISTESFAKFESMSQYGIREMAKYDIVQPLTDWASLNLVIVLSHNPVEFVVWKLALNAATHVGLDLGGKAVKRIKSFRPSAPTLAV